MTIKIYSETGEVPVYQTNGAAAFDLVVTKHMVLSPKSKNLIPTGLYMAIPEGYYLSIVPRSGLSLRSNLRIPNTPGTVDSDYRDEIKIMIENTGSFADEVRAGERIAQGIIKKYEKVEFEKVNSIEELGTTDRKGGFGSTGIR